MAGIVGGADLVVELPLAWACAPAQRFAAGGVALLDALGCHTIAFGSECGDLSLLTQAAAASRDGETAVLMRQLLKEGLTFAAARQSALAQRYPAPVVQAFDHPNDNLCVEYLLALQNQHSSMEPLALRRIGAGHDSAQITGNIASASHIRKLLADGKIDLAFSLLPQTSRDVVAQAMPQGLAPASLARAEAALLAKLRTMKAEDFGALADISDGLENRLYSAARQACTLEEFLQLAKTKRYTLARLRRLTLAAFLDLRQEALPDLPPYLRVLGFNSRGRELLSAASQKSALPLSHSLAKLEALGGAAAAAAALEARATDLYSLMLPTVQPCGEDYRAKVISL